MNTIASMGILVAANVAPAMREMDKIGGKVKAVGQTAQKEGTKTEGFMKRWGSAFAAIGAAATASLYMIVKASPLLAGAMQEAQDAMDLLRMTIGDALETALRPLVDTLWTLTEATMDMPAPLALVTASFIEYGWELLKVGGIIAIVSAAAAKFGLTAAAPIAAVGLLGVKLGGVALAAGLAAAAFYHLSGEPTVAIMGALTTIGVGATVLFHQPVIFAITSIASAFVMMAGACGNMETLVSAAFLSIGIAATALMGHPVVAGIIGIVGGITLLIRSSADLEIKTLAVFTSIGIAASALLAHPAIAAITLLIDALYLLKKATDAVLSSWKKFTEGPEGVGLIGGELLIERALSSPFQYGGYVPATGPAFLHAGEYVVPRGRAGGAGAVYHVDYHPTIEISATLKDRMDVEELKRTLDDLYKREIGQGV